MRQGEEQKPVQRAAGMYPAMACLRAERWKLLSWALQVQGWPKSFHQTETTSYKKFLQPQNKYWHAKK